VTREPNVQSPEGGFTLTEVLAALIILGVAITAILAAMGTSIIASDVHRKVVTDDAILRNYSEQLASSNVWAECATPATAAYSAASVGVVLPANFDTSIVSIDYWDGNSASQAMAFVGACTPNSAGAGLQRIMLQAHSSVDGRGGTQQIQILKRRP
jgi:prepilin-type N-terminal cleavage/methylation domain-containing protein